MLVIGQGDNLSDKVNGWHMQNPEFSPHNCMSHWALKSMIDGPKLHMIPRENIMAIINTSSLTGLSHIFGGGDKGFLSW